MPDQPPSNMVDRTIGQYLAALGSPAPAPGGGSASGLVGALGTSLGLMALALTDIDASVARNELVRARRELGSLRNRFADLARQDEGVYQAYLDAAALPKGTPADKAARRAAMQEAMKRAASVPLAMCEASAELSEALAPVLAHGNRNLLSDAMVAATFARAGFDASRILVETNLAMIKDQEWVDDVTTRLDDLAQRLNSSS